MVNPFVVAAVLLGVATASMFVVLFYLTASVRATVRDVTKARWSALSDVKVEPPSGLRESVRAYIAVADVKNTKRLRQMPGVPEPAIREGVRMTCDGGTSVTRTGDYRGVRWLVMMRKGGGDALFQDAIDGKVKYAVIGGAAFRLVASEKKEVLQMIGREAAGVRLFLVAPAYAVLPDRNARGGRCTAETLLPMPSDAEQVFRRLDTLDMDQLPMHVWTYGWGERGQG